MADKNYSRFFFTAYLILFTTGVGVISTGAVLPEIVSEFSLGYDAAGLLVSVQAIGNMLSLVVCGYLSDIIGRKYILLTGPAMIAAGFFGISFASSTPLLFGLIFIAGCGWGINNIASIISNDITGGSASHLNRLHIFFAAGAFAAPFLVVAVSALGFGWRAVCVVIGVMAAVSTALAAFVKIPETKKARNAQPVSFEAFTQLRYYIFIIIAFSYTAVEFVMNGWITTYFQDTGLLTGVRAKIVLSLVWLSIMTGRVLFSFIGDRIKKERVLVMCAVVILIFSAALTQLSSFIGVAVCVFALGLGLSAVIPTNLANAVVTVKNSGAAMGVLISSGGLGAAAGPVVTGIIAERLGLYASIWTAAGFACVLALAAGVNYILGKNNGKV